MSDHLELRGTGKATDVVIKKNVDIRMSKTVRVKKTETRLTLNSLSFGLSQRGQVEKQSDRHSKIFFFLSFF